MLWWTMIVTKPCDAGVGIIPNGQLSHGHHWRPNRHIQVDSVQCRFFFVFGNSVRYTMLFELLSLAIHHFKNTLAGQFGFAATLT
jgi:hypothetical protein